MVDTTIMAESLGSGRTRHLKNHLFGMQGYVYPYCDVPVSRIFCMEEAVPYVLAAIPVSSPSQAPNSLSAAVAAEPDSCPSLPMDAVPVVPAVPSPAPIKPNPILFLGGHVGDTICKLIAEACSADIRHRPFYKFIKIFPRTTEEEEKILAILTEQGVGHFRHAAHRRKKSFIKTVVKGLPQDTDPVHISDALTAQGYTISKVTQLTQTRTKVRLPIFQVLVVRTRNFKTIFRHNNLLGRNVYFESYKRFSGIHQCRICQHFGHSSQYCKMGPRCRYCSLGHDSSTCPTSLEPQSYHCANCGGPHLSSSLGCSQRPKIQKKKFPKSAARQQPQTQQQYPPSNSEDVVSLLDALRTVKDAIADVFGDLEIFKKNVTALAASSTKADKMTILFSLISL